MKCRACFSFLLLLTAGSAACAADAVDFDREVRPILSSFCFPCHGPDAEARQAELRLDTREGLLDAQQRNVLVPGSPNESELMHRITSDDGELRMPPPETKQQLTSSHKAILRRWIATGASWHGHWAFEPPRRPPLPQVHRTEWPQNPIDYFVLAQLEQQQLAPAPPAEKARLLRRVTFDLTGLPPTREQLDAFLTNTAPDAYEQAVDRLLASPEYGQRMAWDWLEAARYADTNGYQGDASRTMWPWRDWVVQALNDNMPYDQFTIEQLAGDLLPEATPQQQLATGFCRNHMINGEGGRIAEENRVEYIFDQIETVGTVWLGLTVQCFRCHDHKFDPLTQREYYQLFDFFNQTPVTGGGGNPQTPPAIPVPNPEQQQALTKLEREIQAAADEVARYEAQSFSPPKPQAPQAGGATPAEMLPEQVQQVLTISPRRRNAAQLETLRAHFRPNAAEYVQRLDRLHHAVTRHSEQERAIPRVMVMQDQAEQRTTYVLKTGLYNQRGAEVTAGVPQVLPPLETTGPPNRLNLARWLVRPDHPLTARVTVNRYWQLFFGTGLVKTVNDFGTQGERPSHPQLLDWLAVEFLDSGWDVKGLHRRIVTSATYRQTAQADPAQIANDPENRLLARGPRFRMPSWMIRDAALAASGLLVHQQGGPGVKPYQPEGVWAEATFGNKRYQPDQGAGLYRRSLYTFWRRIVGPTLFFDVGKRQTCTVTVARTNTPLHALTTLNDVTYVEAARHLAQQVLQMPDQSQSQRVADAFRRVTSRVPTAAEEELLSRRLEILKSHFATRPQASSELLGVGQAPSDPQQNAHEQAAWTTLCLMILNLDESLSK